MKPQDPHPAFKWIFAALFIGCLLSIGCITIRESGAHDVTVNTNGNHNRFDLHTERQNSAQTAQAAASITPGVNGDEAVKSAAKLAATLGTGGAAALPLAAAKIAEPDANPITGEPK
jgi:hypothetical protein